MPVRVFAVLALALSLPALARADGARDLRGALEALGGASTEASREAVVALAAALAADAEPAAARAALLDDLLEAARSRRLPRRRAALATLARAASSPGLASPPVSWWQGSAVARTRMAEAWAALGSDAVEDLTRLLEAGGPADGLGAVAAEALGRLGGEGRRALCATLRAGDDATVGHEARVWAGAALARRAEPEDVDALVAFLLEPVPGAAEPAEAWAADEDPRLAAFRDVGAAAVPPLLRALQSGATEGARARAMLALGRVGSPAAEAAEALAERLASVSTSRLEREAAATALGRIHQPRALRTLLAEGDAETAELATVGLLASGAAGVDSALPLLASSSAVARERARAVLLLLEDVAGPAVPSLLASFPGEPAATRREVAAFLEARARANPAFYGPAALEALEAALGDQDPDVRLRVARTLGRLGPRASPSAPLLERLARDDADVAVRRQAAVSALLVQPEGPCAPPVGRDLAAGLAEALVDSDLPLSVQARLALDRLAPRARDEILAALAAWSCDPATAPSTRRAALAVLQEVSPACPGAATSLALSADPASRLAGLEALAARGHRIPCDLVGPALAWVEAHDPALRLAAVHALARCPCDPRLAAPALARALGDRDPRVRDAAIDGLAGLGAAAACAAPALLRQLAEGPDALRRLAPGALARVAPADPCVAVSLAGALCDGDPGVRAAAADALGDLGPHGQEAVGALLEARSDPELSVQAAATRALYRLGWRP
jgi:HEAT repeat protein